MPWAKRKDWGSKYFYGTIKYVVWAQLLIMTEVGIVSAHSPWRFPLASGIKKSIMCLCWGNWFLPWVSSFPWREQCIAVIDFEILNTSPERPIFPSEGCPSVWSAATLSVLLRLLSLHCLSFEIEVLMVLEEFCLLVFLQNPFLVYPCFFILCGCVCINAFSCFKCYWNQGIMK